MKRTRLIASLLIAVLAVATPKAMWAQSLADYTAYPPFISDVVPPVVMFVMSKDHKLFYKAYNDVMDLDEDGTIDITYTDTIDYYGYFDPKKCYTYTSGQFEPTVAGTGANGHYCTSEWSGNFLNWATMSRIDILRKVFYGGERFTDNSTQTVLMRALLPQDAHSWVKVYKAADVSSLTPFAWGQITLCNLNTSKTDNESFLYVKNGLYPYAASTEGKQCTKEFPGGPAFVPDSTYNVLVKVCVASKPESNCVEYQSGKWKPTGIMQRFGLNRQNNFDPTDDVVQMKFGLITGSFGGNVSGGLLRSNIVDVNSEFSNSNGILKASSSVIKTLSQLKVTQYNYSTGWYDAGGSEGSCVPSEPATLSNGVCTSWGNPIAEMLYETIRYFKGETNPTTEFDLGDPGFTSLPDKSNSWADPYASCPECAQPYALIISDAFPSYDSDHLPGSYWPATITPSTGTPSVQTLISNANMNTLEGIGNVFVGESAGTFNRACTAKTGDFTNIRGLCGEEPTKRGAFYLAGLAHYGKTTDLRSGLTGDQKMTTFSVMTGSPIPDLQFTVGTDTVQLIPIFHDGCPDTSYPGCGSQGAGGDNSKGALVDFQFCQNDADFTTEQGNGYTSCYDIMWDDAEYGWDYELDIRHRMYVKTGAGTITVKVKGLSAAAGHTDYAGYLIQGVTGQGEYYEIKCGGGAGFSDCDRYDGNETAENERTFTVTGSSTGFLKDPLWYAAKYGGFKDEDGDGTPNLASEWDADGNGRPDTYFHAANPLKLEEQLGNAMLAILQRASAGSAASVLASSSTGEGALYQAFFFPSLFEGTREVKWTGATQGLFLDAFGNLREDTVNDAKLVYEDDQIVRPRFDVGLNKTVIDRYNDSDANGLPDTGTPVGTVDLKDMTPIWEGGTSLANMNSCDRNIETWVDLDGDKIVDAGEQIEFNANCAGRTSNTGKLAPYIRAGAAPYTAENIINFIRGDQIANMRDRQLTVGGSLKVWKLGDPVNAQPIVVGAPAQRYDIIYGDITYADFFNDYKDRRQVAYVGANDGMLHAFNAGFFHRGDDPATVGVTEHGYFKTTQAGVTKTPPLGDEMYAFIPQELLPHLQWLTRTDYTHVYYVDATPKATDVRIFCDAGGGAPAPCVTGQTGVSHPNGWGTILMGGFQLGGSCGACTAGGGAPPMTITGDFDNNVMTPDETRTFYSAVYVLDITSPEEPPKLLMSFSSSDLGLTTARPSMLRVSPAADGMTVNTNAKWFMIVGSGPTGYGGSIAQAGNFFAIDFVAGPGFNNINVKKLEAETMNAFLSSTLTIDNDFDYRVDVTYAGSTIHDGSLPWRGKLYRLTKNDCLVTPCTPGVWGVNPGGPNRRATEILNTFVDDLGTTLELGPVTASPAVTVDDSNKLWVFGGTGRLWDSVDRANTDKQYFVGTKDSVLSGTCAEVNPTSCLDNDLVDMSSAEVCVIGIGTCGGATDQVTGVTTGGGASDFPSLIALVQSRDGWFTKLPDSGERALVRPLVFGGLVLFPTYLPNSDACKLNGTGYMYALYYKTGGAYSAPVIGSTGSGSNQVVNRRMSTGVGMASQAVVHVGKGGSGGKMTAYVQKSSGELTGIEVDAVAAITSRFVTWFDKRG